MLARISWEVGAPRGKSHLRVAWASADVLPTARGNSMLVINRLLFPCDAAARMRDGKQRLHLP